jgi:glutamate-1-semialdehyde 2,1-aminomutase
MFQFYLRDQGLELSWVGSGRMIMSLNFSPEDFEEVTCRFVRAAQQMSDDGWWWHAPELTAKAIQKQLLAEMLRARFPLLDRIKTSMPDRQSDIPGEIAQ